MLIVTPNTTTTTNKNGTSSITIPFKLPFNHLSAVGTSCCEDFASKYDIIAFIIACIPIPISISLPPENPEPLDNTYISDATRIPETTAAIETPVPLIRRTNIQKTAATLEPELIPIISGLANGFLNIV